MNPLTPLGCGHCQNAKPKFLKASEAFAEEANKAFTAVDCTQDSGTFKKVFLVSERVRFKMKK